MTNVAHQLGGHRTRGARSDRHVPAERGPPGQRSFGYEARAGNAVFLPGVTAELITADPDASRPQWVDPATFWTDLDTMLAFNPHMSSADTAMADQARALVVLHRTDERHRALLDRAALVAEVALHESAT